MGNYQQTGRQLWAHQCLPRGSLPGFRSSSSGTSDTDSESDCNMKELIDSGIEKLQYAVLNNNIHLLEDLLCAGGVDPNLPINSKDETALMMSVKLSQLDIVKSLLAVPSCDNNCHNVYHCSVLDVALITLFDKRDDPDRDRCWQIFVMLLQAKSEPLSKDAMTYVIRTALKYGDVDFISQLISTAIKCSRSPTLHRYLLEKLHRHQPIYPGNMDPILEQLTGFTIALLRNSSTAIMLRPVVHAMVYYLESYWHSRETKSYIFQQLVVYASGAGWNWTPPQIAFIEKVNAQLALWCCRRKTRPPSLSHSCRVAFRSNLSCPVTEAIVSLPYHLPDLITNYILLRDLDSTPDSVLLLSL